MANPNLWGAEKLVNTTVNSPQQYSQVVALEGGGHVVVWANFNTGEIHARVFDAFGAPVASQLNLTPNVVFAQGAPHVAAVPGGGFAVSFSGQPDNYAHVVIQTAVFDASGAPVTGTLLVNEKGAGHGQVDNAITGLGDGTYVVAYITSDTVNVSQTIAVQRFNADGSKLGAEIVIGVDVDHMTQNLNIADVGGGRFAVLWDTEDMGDRNVYAHVVGYDGVKQGTVFPVNEGADWQTAAGVAGDGSGSFLVAFHDTGDQLGEQFQALVQLYGANNLELPTGPNGAVGPAQISDFGQNGNFTSSPAITALHGGGYMAVWIETTVATKMVIGQLVDSTGNRIGDEFVIKQAPSAMVDYYALALATLADGRVVLTWYDDSGTLGDSDVGVHSQILDPRFGTITGTAASETLVGSFGVVDDTLTSGDGRDTLAGGLGDDTYVVTGGDDLVVEGVNEGIDTVVASVAGIDHALGLNVENLTLLAGANGTGNGLANVIVGNSGNNVLDGEAGNDTMKGLAGDDTYVVDSAGDVVVETINGGTDTVIAHVGHALAANVEKLSLVAGANATGNASANVIKGNAAANTINGLGGADTMTGFAGDDTYIVADAGDVVVEGADAGFDTVHAAFNFTLGANLENLVLTGGAVKGTGNELANRLVGNALANTLKGGLGNDTIEGGGGKDALEGGKGSDTYVLGSSKDKVTDKGGADDAITSTSSRKLADFKGIENLTLVGAGNAKGTGNDAANDLMGNAGRNELKGGGGKDLLAGGLGRDLLWGDAGKDIFDFNAVAEIGKAKGARDIIRDFDSSDRIDLSTIDANPLTGGNGKFKLLAKEGSKFGGVAGQLIWDQQDKAGTSKDVTLVSGDLNGDKVADFTLELSGLHNLNKSDFIL